MTVEHYYDPNLELPQFRVLEESESLLGWVEGINLTIQDLASKWPWTRRMYCGHDPYDQVCASYKFLAPCHRNKAINKKRTSYGLKHDVEQACWPYVAEGYFLVAATMHDLKLQPTSDCTSFHLNLRCDQKYYDQLEAMRVAQTTSSKVVAASI
jgi:hypothetical protein